MSRHRNAKHLIEEDYDDYEDDYYDYDDYDDYAGGSATMQAPKQSKKQTAKAAKAAPKQQPLQKKGPGKSPVKPPKSPQRTDGNHSRSNSKSPVPPNSLTKGAGGSASVTSPTVSSPIPKEPAPAVPTVLLESSAIQQQPGAPKRKIPLTVVILGHVDAGKSTVTGHLLYGSGGGAKPTSSTSAATSRRSNVPVNYAWLLDEDDEERAHGNTMDIATKQLVRQDNDDCSTTFDIVLQDAPGHADYVPAMITGTSAADAACVCVDATNDLASLLVKGQLREHVYLARGLGVTQILVLFTKMDLVGWDNAEAYRAMEGTIRHFLVQQVGYPAARVRCLPVSGLSGTNIFKDRTDDETMALRTWYKGPTLLQALDTFEPPIQQQQKLLEKPLRIVVSDVLDGGGSGVAVRSKVVSGWVKQGESVVVLPIGDEASITKFSSLHLQDESGERKHYSVAGELLDCTIANIDAQRVSTGSILCRPTNRPPLSSRCRAKIFVLDGLTIPLIRGAQVVFHMHTLDIPCNITILTRTLKADGTPLKERPRALTKSCNAVVEVKLSAPICMESFADCRALGRFVLRRSGDSIAVGRIEEVLL